MAYFRKSERTLESEYSPLQAILKKRGITQRELAKQLGMTQSAISQILSANARGESRKSTIEKLCAELDIKPEQITPRP